MTKEEMQIMREMMKEVVSEQLKPVHKKLDTLQFQMDTVYNWVDRVDMDVKHLKQAK